MKVGHALGTHAGIEARVSLESPAGYDACWRLRHDGFVLRHDTYFVESVALPRAFLLRAIRFQSSVDLLAAARALLCRLAQLLEGCAQERLETGAVIGAGLSRCGG